MLQKIKPQLVPESDARAEIVSAGDIVSTLATFVRRQLRIILSALAVTLCLGMVYLFNTPPSFTSQATMLIDTRKVQMFQQQGVLGDIAIDTGVVDSQVEILRSEKISLAVIKDLNLTEDPEFVGRGGGLLGALFWSLHDTIGSGPPRSEFELKRRAVEAFSERLFVRRLGLTYIIQINFRSLNPDRAAQIANAVAEAYIVDQLEAKYQATRRAGAWLQDRIAELRHQASAAEQAVVAFKTRHNIVNTGVGGRLMNEQQLGELNSQLTAVRAQTAEARARLDRINEIIRADAPDATVTDTLRNDVITKLRQQYLELKSRDADWSARYGRNHQATVNLRNQMAEIRRSMVDELRRIAETYKSDYEIARQREESIQKGLAEVVSESQTTNQAQVALRDLESTSQTYRSLHDNFLQRYMESVQQQSFPITEARLITPASRPLQKSHPKTLVILAICGVGGLMLGLGIARLRELSDRVFRTADQVEGVLHANCISIVPALPGRQVKEIAPYPAIAITAGDKSIVPQKNVLWQVVDAPFSAYAEAIRSIKVAADLSRASKSNKVIGFTSALPNEGKSTVACSLAQLVSHAGARTILVDCDLRNPALTRSLAPGATVGILDVIARRASLEDVIWNDPATGLSFLPAAVHNHFAHTSEILASDAMRKLFDWLRDHYDYVVVDLSPLAPVVDVRTTSHFVDGYVFVIQWGETKIDTVKHALGTATGIHEAMLGVVLNRADMSALGRYDGNRGGYYQNKHYSRYGYGR
jgi:succinoglycan biosynthesis transport protein ExoP